MTVEKKLKVLRREVKYKLNYREFCNVYHLLKGCLTEDIHNLREEGYLVRSLYFDSFYDTDYFDKEDGYEERKKMRLRVYSPTAQKVKLELKAKHGDNQKKESLLIGREEANDLIRGEYSCLDQYSCEVAQTIMMLLKEKIYRPKTMIEYRRKAFAVIGNDIRITFDSEMRASESDFDLFNETPIYYPIQNQNEIVMEVKYSHFLFGYLKELLSQSDRDQITYSKYYMARSVSKNMRMNV